MRTLPPDKLAAGMRVVAPVTNAQNVLLLKAGTTLTEKNIRILKTWGVQRVTVDGQPDTRTADGDGCSSERAQVIAEALEETFADVSDDPLMGEIMRVAGNLMQKRAQP